MRLCLLGAVLLAAARCGSVAAVRALPRGSQTLALSVGGPVTNVSNIDIPIPYVVLRYRYGLSDRAGLYAGGHLLMSTLGVVGLDGGFSYSFVKQDRWLPEFGGSIGLATFIKPAGASAVFPELDIAASYLLAGRSLTYFGVQSVYQLSAKPEVAFAPLVGEELRLGRALSLNAEAKWYAPTEKTKPRNVDYPLGIGNQGALGFVLGANYHFGGWYEAR